LSGVYVDNVVVGEATLRLDDALVSVDDVRRAVVKAGFEMTKVREAP
jgi:hypothetical protein